MTEFLITLRPDIPHVRDLLLMTDVFYRMIHLQEVKGEIDSNKSLNTKGNLGKKSNKS